MIVEGETAPDLVVTTIAADRVDLRAPALPLVLFFFHEAGSHQSAATVDDFEASHYEFERLGVQIVGVGVDGVAPVEAFSGACGLHYALADDHTRTLCRAFGVLDRASNRPLPSTFVIDTDGVVRRVFPAIPPYGHARDVLDAARELWG